MATNEAARLLDELMGRYRNLMPNEMTKKLSWDSPDICRYYLVKFCPNELFTNTKSDLGLCDKIHDDEVKKEYQASTSHRKLSYEDEFIRYCDMMLSDVDRKIEKGKQRLALSIQEAMSNASTGDGKVDEQIMFLSERITGLVNEAERLGSEGNVEEAQGLSKLCDKLREERDALRRTGEGSVWHQQAAEMAASQEKQMEVCEICGAFLIVGDAQQRIDDHLMGKQHVGYARLRQAVIEIRSKREDYEKQREKEREERRKALDGDRRRDRDRDERRRSSTGHRVSSERRDRSYRDEHPPRDRESYRGRDRSDRDSHSRSKGRERDRDRHRSRDNDRDRRNRDHY